MAIMTTPTLRPGWLPGTPTQEEQLSAADDDHVTVFGFGTRRIVVREVADAERAWARGVSLPRWKRRTIDGRQIDWRHEGDEVVACTRIEDRLVWVRGGDFDVEDVVKIAASLSASA
jgi:hypothetical protein